MTDPVSWFLIEPGWKVLDAAGEEVGSVDDVVGDSGNDIFNGLSISTSLLGRPRYVPSEQVGAITDGCVALRIAKEEVERLGEYQEPASSTAIAPDRPAPDAPISHEERLSFLTRLRHAFRRIAGR